MKIENNKKIIITWMVLIFFVPIILTIVMALQWETNNSIIMLIIIGIIWLIAIAIAISILKGKKQNPYPSYYLVDYNTLIKYMREEEQFSFDNNLEASFHYYLYQDKEKIEVQSWHYIASRFEDEKKKGNIYYWNKEEYSSLDNLINSKIKRTDDIILIELIDSSSTILDEYKNNHKELDVVSYIENNKKSN